MKTTYKILVHVHRESNMPALHSWHGINQWLRSVSHRKMISLHRFRNGWSHFSSATHKLCRLFMEHCDSWAKHAQAKKRSYRIALKQHCMSVGNDDAQKHIPKQGGLGSCLVRWYTINTTSLRSGSNQERTHRSCMRSFTDAWSGISFLFPS